MSQQASWDYIAKCICLGDSGTGKSSLTIRLCEGRFSARTDTTIGVEFGSRVVPVGPPASDSLNLGPSVSGRPTKSRSTSRNADDDDDDASASPDAVLPQRNQQPQDAQKSTNKGGRGSRGGSRARGQDDAVATEQQKHMKLSLWDTAGQETYKSITRSYFRGASGALLVFDITRRATFESVTAWLRDLRAVAEEGIVVVLVGNKSDLAPASTVSSTPSAGPPQENKRQVTRAEAEGWASANNILAYVETSAKSGQGVERAFLALANRIFLNIQAGRYDLNDRRSGVKSARAANTASAASAAGVSLAVDDVNAISGQRSSSCC